MTGWAGGSTGNCEEIEVWLYEQMVYEQPIICPGEWDTQTPLGIWLTNESVNLGQRSWPYINQRKKRT